ncbi:TetR/AcrR family transcriptional regulator [Asticcacaulis sp. AC460]|uniref:TetR/AcrR family transcriptional regulator n=1 Tax=Asticcacaulis sp. AC460 TaxID=1282360 RepID=UPI0004CE036A|nr:TetR/AcrR family transcriptional regulator [Asticcacaulis sp. AC460]
MSIATSEVTNRRDPGRTRQRLLMAGFEEVYRSGFQGCDLNAILGKAGVTKGALYHHFDSKDALGHAILEDVVAKITDDKWLTPLRESDTPLDTLITIIEGTFTDDEHAAGGCPLNNLAQEMSRVEEGFRARTAALFTTWIDTVADALTRAQAQGSLRPEVDARAQAQFVVAAYEGYMSIAKSLQSGAVLEAGVRQLVSHLNSLRPEPQNG